MVGPRCFNVKVFSELYFELCDAIDLVNSAFTFNLSFAMLTFLAVEIFGCYGVLREFISREKNLLIFLSLANSVWVSVQYSIKALMAHAGSSTTKEAETSLILVTKLTASLDSVNPLKAELLSLLIQMRTFDKKFKNIFFNIDWRIILSVIRGKVNRFELGLMLLYVSDDINRCNLSHHHLSV
jgi:7tm Chemosensory receptor